MATYKTPGVYVEEISKLPPSIAQVETAIPAFIGYTEKAMEYTADDLLNLPTRITSMLDYVQYFGGAPSVDVTRVDLNSASQVTNVELEDRYYLYESMRMFFANGGGPCYIVSVGKYGDTIEIGDASDPLNSPGLAVGLDALKKFDEPTLLLSQDATLLSSSDDMYALYQAMLKQCADLQDRFSVFDVRNPGTNESFDDVVVEFRDKIGMNNLKYGAAYGPYVKAVLPRTIHFRDFRSSIYVNGVLKTLPAVFSDQASIDLATRLVNLSNDKDLVTTASDTLKLPFASLQERYESAIKDLNSISIVAPLTGAPTVRNYLKTLLEIFVKTEDFLLGLNDPTPTLTDTGAGSLVEFLQTRVGASITAEFAAIKKLIADANDTGVAAAYTLPGGLAHTFTGGVTGTYFQTGATPGERVKASIPALEAIWAALKTAFDLFVSASDSFESTLESSVSENIPAYKAMVRSISDTYLTLPPSGPVVGVYAAVDATRGVWKAPANVSLNNVAGPVYLIDNKEQENLNVDVNAGKSINAIRPFTGKGTMIWGARTLAGNDNEWRYISVRRFFNMVEESTRKASEQFVFESNDANTWVRIKGMISNFLTDQWKQGALAGAKPEHAFYVNIGLGETMTAEDILNGRMNIEIGLAVVRPAEFIILKFSHKMQES